MRHSRGSSHNGPWLGLLIALAACRDTHATALVVAISSDSAVTQAIDTLEISVTRAGQTKLEQSYSLPRDGRLPGTLTLQKNEDASSSDPIEITVTGRSSTSNASAPIISRSARLGFVDEHTKLLRMPLRGDCLGVES
ncbi:MAG: hypothetical protein U0165_01355 [Polyangiaceae bacterium]